MAEMEVINIEKELSAQQASELAKPRVFVVVVAITW